MRGISFFSIGPMDKNLPALEVSSVSSFELLPCSISLISSLIFIIASQNLSNSFRDSLSVGSIIKVPATGHDIVGA